jgi:hypothetical protein
MMGGAAIAEDASIDAATAARARRGTSMAISFLEPNPRRVTGAGGPQATPMAISFLEPNPRRVTGAGGPQATPMAIDRLTHGIT